MARKCVCCGEFILPNEESVPYKRRYAHVRCFNAAMKAITTKKVEENANKSKAKKSTSKGKKPTAEMKKGLSEEEFREKERYFNYLRKLTSEEKLSAKIYKLTEDYIRDYNFSYDGMYKTLVYFYHTLDNVPKQDCIGIIPYYYEQAQKHYQFVERVEEENKDAKVNELYTVKTITISPKREKAKLIDIDKIGEN